MEETSRSCLKGFHLASLLQKLQLLRQYLRKSHARKSTPTLDESSPEGAWRPQLLGCGNRLSIVSLTELIFLLQTDTLILTARRNVRCTCMFSVHLHICWNNVDGVWAPRHHYWSVQNFKVSDPQRL